MQIAGEDKIVLMRLGFGLFYGTLIYLLGSLRLIPVKDLNMIAWTGAAVLYAVTIILVYKFVRPVKSFNLYLRGISTYYASWLLTSFILNEISPLI
ncbi:MAG: hypothetical protein QXV51_03315 [Thermosphaera sp.]